MRPLFEKYCGLRGNDVDGRPYEIRTQKIVVDSSILPQVAELSLPYLGAPEAPIALVYDANTYRVAGAAVREGFGARFRKVVSIELTDDPKKGHVVCDDKTIDDLQAAISDASVAGVIGIGSGSISDLVKMSTHRLSIPCVTVPTAPSNNGYTSAIAAILSKGIKTTQPCEPVAAVFCDTEVMRMAPYRMIASGIGDLYSKPVSNADWRLSAHLTGSFYSAMVMEIVNAGSSLLEGVAPDLPSRSAEAVAALSGSIMLSGLGMQAAGSSGPASGGEHLVSHYLDMTSASSGEGQDFHGCQVAVGTVVTAALYGRLRAQRPDSIDIDGAVRHLPAWEDYKKVLQARFGELTPAVLEHAGKAYPTRDVVRERLEQLVRDWDEIMSVVGETLRPAEELAAELDSADCPIRFNQIGVSRARAESAVLWCKDIRNRYTILHLLWEVGVLDDWGREIVDAQFAT
jgi:glycerol-1-phosphate dehydrogenase [NAD(P)+]